MSWHASLRRAAAEASSAYRTGPQSRQSRCGPVVAAPAGRSRARLRTRLYRAGLVGAEILAVLAATAGLAALVAPGSLETLAGTGIGLLFVPLTWIALRHGWRAVVLAAATAGAAILAFAPAAVLAGTAALPLVAQTGAALAVGIVVGERRRSGDPAHDAPDGQTPDRSPDGHRSVEQALADRTAALIALVNAAHDDAVALLAPDGTVLTCNERAALDLGTTVQDLTGRRVWDLMPDDLAEDRRARVAEAVAGRRPVRFEEHRHGRWLVTSLYPSFADDGRPVGIAVLARDITERKAAAEALDRAVTRLTHAEQVARLGHWQCDLTEDRLDWSPGMFALFGVSPETGQPRFDTFLGLVHPDDRPRVEAAVAAARAEAAPRSIQYRIVRPDGSLGHIESRVDVIVRPDGTPSTILGVALDLTDRLAAEVALRESEVRYRSLIERSRFGIVEVDRDGVILSANPAMHRLFGDTGTGLKGTCVRELAEESGRAGMAVDVARFGADPASAGPYLSRLIGNDGGGIDVEIDWTPKRDRDGTVTGFIGMFSDVTARRRADAELHRFRTIVESSQEAIAVSDVRGRLVYANPAHRRLFGYAAGDGTTLDNADQYQPDSLDVLEREVYPRCRLGESWEGVLQARDAAGRRFPVWERRDALPGPDGVPILIIGMMHDYSDEERRQWEIREARDRAEQANVAKSRFLAAASHDLRQPLQALVMFFDLLSRRNRDPKLSDLIDKIGQSLGAFQDMLNTLLDISKLDAGIMHPETGPVALGPVLARLDDEFAPMAEAAGLILVTMPTGLVALTDQGLLERMLRNLLSNAIQYTQRGRVLLGCRRSGTAIRLQVHDTGIGIPEDQLEAIFGEYYQIDNLARDRHHGLGLGLAIVHRLSRLLDHPVRVRSMPGRGTMFEVEVPRAHAPAVAATWPVPVAAASSGLIALLDDNPEVLRALQMSLEGFGHQVIAATDTGRLAHTLRQSGRSPDIIMADFRLAGGDTGSDAIRVLRAHFGADIPGILLTGDTSPERLREATGSGFRLLHKPIRPAELSRLVDDYLLAAQE